MPTMLLHTSNDELATTHLLISSSSTLETKPLLSRAFSFNGGLYTTRKHQQRRRRTASNENILSLQNGGGGGDNGGGDRSIVSNVEHVAAETLLITRLSLKLLSYLGLDLYLPKNSEGPKPVVAFITGGAWIIGIYLMGQSAGAHIAACTLVEQAIKEVGKGNSVTWSVSQIKSYFGLSGGYNLLDLVDHFHNRGLYRNIFLSIMEGEQSLRQYSPEIMVQDPNVRCAVSLLPPTVLFHGTADYSIPSNSSESFAATLQRLGVDAQAIMYEGKTHTDVFLQDPMRGGSDQMFEDLVSIIHAGDEEALAKDAKAPPRKRLVPEIMLKLARAVSPF